MPNVTFIHMVRSDLDQATLVAATAGRGVYTLPVPQFNPYNSVGDKVGVFDIDGYSVSTGGYASAFDVMGTLAAGFPAKTVDWGVARDKALTGDWNGDGVSTVGLYRNSSGDGQFLLKDSNDSATPITYQFYY